MKAFLAHLLCPTSSLSIRRTTVMRSHILRVFTALTLVLVTSVHSIALPDNGTVDHRQLKVRQAATPASSASSAPATTRAATSASTATATAASNGNVKVVVNNAAVGAATGSATASAAADAVTAICNAPEYVYFCQSMISPSTRFIEP